MRRVLSIVVVAAALAALLTVGAGAKDDGGSGYEVRAIFDNGSFLVPGEEVRIAGATVGTISEVDVSRPGEVVHDDGSAEPGKAVVVLEIDDPGFRSFRQDASCLIRPQSLLGEKFVECEPTQPRAAGTEPAPELVEIADGEPGGGQRLLPVENNLKAVDLDLVNNILEEPYPDRFRLILNDLGAGLAARGEDLAEIVERSNPALRETNEVLGVLAKQNRKLAQLASDGDRVLGPLARERDRVSGFINASEATARAALERRAELEAGFQRLPGFLREVRLTMPRLRNFADQATPTVADLGAAAPSLTRATVALEPFANSANTALKSLGDAAEASQGDIVASDPILVELRDLARGSAPAAKSLRKLLTSLRKTDGFEYITRFVYYSVGIANGFDSFGHFTRSKLPLNNCVDYEKVPESGCDAFYRDTSTSAALSARQRMLERMAARYARKAKRARSTVASDQVTEAGATLFEFIFGQPEESNSQTGAEVEPVPGADEEPSEDESAPEAEEVAP